MNTTIATQVPVYVALSGGVDSAVAASLLQQQHEQVIGISHRHWPESRCCSTDCIDRCAEQCRGLGIPYYPVECIVEFANAIVENFVERYESGVTPNPCVLCNEQIRFDLMIKKHFSQVENPPDDYKLATGHYARVEERNGRFHLMRGVDRSKDQSYMLHRLSQEELSHVIFPLGDKMKTEVRALAESLKLQSAKIEDSMDVCFVQDTYQEFIRQYSDKVHAEGDFVDMHGNVVGRHKGLAFYTRGQRSGLGLSGGPWFVISIDTHSGTIRLGRREDLMTDHFSIYDMHWVYPETTEPFTCSVETRYRSKSFDATVTPRGDGRADIRLTETSHDITPGQSAVFYNGDDVIGGGIICEL
jgi:tRNA-specific 2-thiouridylase